MPKAPYKSFRDIPPFTPWGNYEVDITWSTLEHSLARYDKSYGLDLDPDFQRGYVWTRKQQIAYVEYCLRGGRASRMLLWNCPDWDESTGLYPITIVDGKQRLAAARAFLHDEVPAFGRMYSKYEGRLSLTGPNFRFVINSLKTRAEVLQWYLDLNSGGTVHTSDELTKVRRLLRKEQK